MEKKRAHIAFRGGHGIQLIMLAYESSTLAAFTDERRAESAVQHGNHAVKGPSAHMVCDYSCCNEDQKREGVY